MTCCYPLCEYCSICYEYEIQNENLHNLKLIDMDFLEFVQKELENAKKCRSKYSSGDPLFGYFEGMVVAYETAIFHYKFRKSNIYHLCETQI